jgi:pyocin large subunit-like protein
VQNAFDHWKNHGHEFPGLSNSKQYVERTHNFFGESRDQLLTKIRSNGEILLYDVQTNTFGAFTANGVPKTMFKPMKGILYWETRN